MSDHATAHARAEAQVAAARDDPAARLALIARVFHGPTGHAPTLTVPTSGVVVHALAGAPGCAQPARRVAARQRVVAGGQRATAAGRMRNGRAAGWVGRRAVVAGRTALAGVQRETDGAQLVPSA